MRPFLNHKSFGIYLIWFIFLVIFLFSSCWHGQDDDTVIARVGGIELGQNDLKKRMTWEGLRSDQRSEFIERWVDRELLFQEAKKQGLDKLEEFRLEMERSV